MFGFAGSEPKDAASASSSRTSSQAMEAPAPVGQTPEAELVCGSSLPESIGLTGQTASILEVLRQLESLNRSALQPSDTQLADQSMQPVRWQVLVGSKPILTDTTLRLMRVVGSYFALY